ncbi:MAG: COQ9 family protein [Gemmatimonas sp.]
MNPSYAADAELRRSRILAATVPHVPFDGWTWRAVSRGAKDAGYAEAEAHLAYPGGIRDVVAAYSDKLDRRMQEAVEARGEELRALRTKDRIAFVLRLRFEAASGEREALRRLAAFLAMPENCGLGTRLLWNTVDRVWRAAGDRSTDFNYYTKRGLLAGVVASAVLYWLADQSEGYLNTWTFIDRRLDDVLRIGSLPHRFGAWVEEKAGGLFRRRPGFRPWARRAGTWTRRGPAAGASATAAPGPVPTPAGTPADRPDDPRLRL